MSFLSKSDKERLSTAIAAAEKNTSGEIVVSVLASVKEDIYKAAQTFFDEKELYKTKQRNATLIYLAYTDHKLAVLGDEGINALTPDDFWEDVLDHMIQKFKEQLYVEGLEEGIMMISEKLKEFFPWTEDDVNELPDGVHEDV